MSQDTFEVADANDSHSSGKKRAGCYISLPVGFVLVLLAALLAVGVGIIVHFAGGSRNVVCNCQSSGTVSAEQIRKECIKLIENGDKEVCKRCPTESNTAPEYIGYRLPTSVHPLHYDLELQPYMHDPDPRKFTFKGSVKILLRCDNTTNNITLHVDVLTVDPSSIRLYSGTPSISGDPKYVTFEEDKARQFFIVRLDKNMEAGKNYSIEMKFTSPLTNDLIGLYYSKYKRDTDNQTIYLATTQFEATHARKAFPCFDEPAMKATFNITLVRPADRVSLSNMPIINSDTTFKEDGKTYVKDVYQETVQMSTYLLAFVVCDYKFLTSTTKYNVTFKTWAKPQSVKDTRYALDLGVKITQYFEDYFDIKYPLPKQDMIAISSMRAAAMENWGLITYGEKYMLYTDGVTSQEDKESMATTVSHELAHQWFGNLVTPSWWSDIWLNEGFATFVSYIGVDQVHPEWRMFEKFITRGLQLVFDVDGRTDSHPVYVQVQHPDDINNIFDGISYNKGGSIIRMMRFFLGEETFRKGIINYLKNRLYRTATHDALWDELTKQAQNDGRSVSVKNIMDTWILQMNYPVVTVTPDFSNPSMIQVTQERFLSDKTALDPGKYTSPFNYRWSIPLTFTSSKDPRFSHDHRDVLWLHKQEANKTLSVNIPLPDTNDKEGWILANVQQYGFYRVNYQPGNWVALARQLERNHSVIPVINRAQIINDAWSLNKANYIQLHAALATIQYLNKERDYIPWYAAVNEFTFLDSMLFDNPLHGAFQNLMKDKLTEPFQYFGISNISEGHVDVLTQALIAEQSCYYGIKSCLDEVSRQYRLWMTDPSRNPINPNMKSVVYCHAVANGGWDEWNFTLQMYKDADTKPEKVILMSAMACSKHPEILRHYLNILLQEESLFTENSIQIAVASVAKNNMGRQLAWDFISSNYYALETVSFSLAYQIAVYTFKDFSETDPELEEESYFMLSDDAKLAVEIIKSNINWKNTRLPIITKWLTDNNYLTE